METSIKLKFKLDNLHCAGCANKIEGALNESDLVEKASLNFATKQLVVMSRNNIPAEVMRDQIDELIQQYENGVVVTLDAKKKPVSHAHDHDTGDHDHPHDHDHAGATDKEFREKLTLGIGGAAFALGVALEQFTTGMDWLTIGLLLLAYLLIGGGVLLDAFNNIKRGSWFDEKFLMSIATFSAWGIGEYPEAVAVMLFFRVGELFEAYAVNKSRKTIEGLIDIKVNTTHIIQADGQIMDEDTDFVTKGSLILVRPGERIPLDGVVEDGLSVLDLSALTGESVPVETTIGDAVYSGAINLNSVLKIRTTANFEDSMVGKILDLIENAGSRKAKTEKFISKFARYYTPAVVFTALGIAIIPPFFTGMNFGEWIYRASIFLVVSCPCALVISVPLGYFGGIGKASKYGILVKGGNYLEALTTIDTVLLDKTGTLTEGKFTVSEIMDAEGKTVSGEAIQMKEFLETVAALESHSNHPIARSVAAYSSRMGIAAAEVTDYLEIAGKGVSAKLNGAQCFAGNGRLMTEQGIAVPVNESQGTIIHVAKEGQYLGALLITDAIKKTSAQAIAALKAVGIKKVIMLTGDKKSIADSVGHAVGVDEIHAELLPNEKVEQIEKNRAMGSKVLFVGDGLNDAPALSIADVGTAMGGVGADLSIEAADMVIMNDDLMKLSEGIKIAKGTQRIIWQNIGFALGVKGLVLILGAFGIATMWEAVFADVGVALLAITNSMRNNA